MSKITTLGIGGKAKDFKIVHRELELLKLVKENSDFLVIGAGSNLLVADEGINKLVIKNEITEISTREESKPTSQVLIKSGTPLQKLVDYAINKGLTGLQKLTGIPGTVGGAVYGNAGAYGQTISDHLTKVLVFNGKEIITLSKDQCGFNYRDSVFKQNKFTILGIEFQLEKGDPAILQKEAEDILAKRQVKYPPGIKCPGSFFKNLVAAQIPPEILNKIKDKIVYGKLPAGALLEMVGARGQSFDGIEIAPYHANLFINKGTGTAKSFYNLAKTYGLKVKEKFGITLEPEVQLINLPPLFGKIYSNLTASIR